MVEAVHYGGRPGDFSFLSLRQIVFAVVSRALALRNVLLGYSLEQLEHVAFMVELSVSYHHLLKYWQQWWRQ